MKADLALLNANVITMDPSFPRAEMVAIGGNKISYVAKNGKLKELKNQFTVGIVDDVTFKSLPILPEINVA